jgi:HSP20 family protein
MDELMERFGAFPGSAGGPFPVNVYDTGEDILAVLEVPGIPKEALQVDVRENALTVTGTRGEAPYKDASALRRECPTGSFTRTLRMPVKVEAEKISAQYRNGLLSVRMPKAEEAKPRQIAINA